jgi:hypothetical protein
MKIVNPRVFIKDLQKTHLDKIQFLVEKTSAIDLDASSLEIT